MGAPQFDATARIDQMLTVQGDGSSSFESNIAGVDITGATNVAQIVVTAIAHGRAAGDYVNITGVIGNTAANALVQLQNVTTDTFEIMNDAGEAIAGNGTYVSAGKVFLAYVIKPPANRLYELKRLNLVAGCSGGSLSEEQYLKLSKLTTGIKVEVHNESGLLATLTPTPLKSWNDWGLVAGGRDVPQYVVTGSKVDAGVRWTFSKSGSPLRLSGATGEFLAFIISDDLDGLTYHRCAVQGFQSPIN